MVLHIAQIHDEITIGKDGLFVFGLTPLDEAIQDVHLPAQSADKIGDLFAEIFGTRDEGFDVVYTSDEDLILDGFRQSPDKMDGSGRRRIRSLTRRMCPFPLGEKVTAPFLKTRM